MKVIPGAKKETVVFNLRREQYEKEFGADYEKPHGFARFLAWIYRLIPKIGPFRALSFSVPTPEAERLFLESFTSTREHFKQSLDALSAGAPASRQHRLRHRASRRSAANIRWPMTRTTSCSGSSPTASSPTSRRACGRTSWRYYGDVDSLSAGTDAQRKRLAKIREHLALLVAVTPLP